MPTLARSGHGRRGVPAVRVGTAPAGSNGLGTEESSTTYIYIYGTYGKRGRVYGWCSVSFHFLFGR